MALPRFSVLLVGAPDNRAWLRGMLPEGAIVAETEARQAHARLAAVTFDLVLADSADAELVVDLEHRIAWNREYRTVPRFYFVECGMPAPQVSRHVFVLEKPVNETLIKACLTRMLDRLELGWEPLTPVRAAAS